MPLPGDEALLLPGDGAEALMLPGDEALMLPGYEALRCWVMRHQACDEAPGTR